MRTGSELQEPLQSFCLPRGPVLPTEARLSLSLDPEPAQCLVIITGHTLHVRCVVNDRDQSESDISLDFSEMKA